MMPGMPPLPIQSTTQAVQSKPGRRKAFETPEALQAAFTAYQAWRKHPDQLQPIGNRKRPRMVSPAPSLQSFAAHCGVSRKTIYATAARDEDMAEALELIRDEIAGELIASGVVRGGKYDPTAALKVAGISDKVEHVTEPKPTATASEQAINDRSAQYHPDDKLCAGPLYTRAQIDAGVPYVPHGQIIEGTTV